MLTMRIDPSPITNWGPTVQVSEWLYGGNPRRQLTDAQRKAKDKKKAMAKASKKRNRR